MRPQNPVAFFQSQSNDNSAIFSARGIDSQRPSKLNVFSDVPANSSGIMRSPLYPASKLLQPKLLPISPYLTPHKPLEKPSPLLQQSRKGTLLGSSSSHSLFPSIPFQLDQSNNYLDQNQPSPSLRFIRHHPTPSATQIPKLNLEQLNPEFTPRQHQKSFSVKNLEPISYSSANRFEAHLEKQNKVLTQLIGMISKQEQIANMKHEIETQRMLKQLHEEKLQADLRLEKEISKRNQELQEKKLSHKSPRKDNSATQELLYDLLFQKVAQPQDEEVSPFKSPRLSSKRLSQLEYSPSSSKLATSNSGNFSSESIDSFDEKPSRLMRSSISRSKVEVSEPVHLFADDGLVEIIPRAKSKTVLKKEGSHRHKNSGRRVTFGGNDTVTFQESN